MITIQQAWGALGWYNNILQSFLLFWLSESKSCLIFLFSTGVWFGLQQLTAICCSLSYNLHFSRLGRPTSFGRTFPTLKKLKKIIFNITLNRFATSPLKRIHTSSVVWLCSEKWFQNNRTPQSPSLLGSHFQVFPLNHFFSLVFYSWSFDWLNLFSSNH